MKQPLSLPKTYSLLQVGRIKQAVIDIFSGHDYLSKRNRAIILVLLYTGIRRDELLNLTTPQIDILGKTILIYRGKGNKDRVVPIPDVLYPHIERFALLRNQTFFNRESDFFFASKNGAQLTEKNLYLIFKKIKEKTGFDVTTHRFRHTYATELIRNNINVYNVSKILGHSDVRTTEIYLSANIQKIAETINSIDMYNTQRIANQ